MSIWQCSTRRLIEQTSCCIELMGRGGAPEFEQILHYIVEAEEHSEKRKLQSVSQTKQEEAEELHLDIHALAGHLTS